MGLGGGFAPSYAKEIAALAKNQNKILRLIRGQGDVKGELQNILDEIAGLDFDTTADLSGLATQADVTRVFNKVSPIDWDTIDGLDGKVDGVVTDIESIIADESDFDDSALWSRDKTGASLALGASQWSIAIARFQTRWETNLSVTTKRWLLVRVLGVIPASTATNVDEELSRRRVYLHRADPADDTSIKLSFFTRIGTNSAQSDPRYTYYRYEIPADVTAVELQISLNLAEFNEVTKLTKLIDGLDGKVDGVKGKTDTIDWKEIDGIDGKIDGLIDDVGDLPTDSGVTQAQLTAQVNTILGSFEGLVTFAQLQAAEKGIRKNIDNDAQAIRNAITAVRGTIGDGDDEVIPTLAGVQMAIDAELDRQAKTLSAQSTALNNQIPQLLKVGGLYNFLWYMLSTRWQGFMPTSSTLRLPWTRVGSNPVTVRAGRYVISASTPEDWYILSASIRQVRHGSPTAVLAVGASGNEQDLGSEFGTDIKAFTPALFVPRGSRLTVNLSQDISKFSNYSRAFITYWKGSDLGDFDSIAQEF